MKGGFFILLDDLCNEDSFLSTIECPVDLLLSVRAVHLHGLHSSLHLRYPSRTLGNVLSFLSINGYSRTLNMAP